MTSRPSRENFVVKKGEKRCAMDDDGSLIMRETGQSNIPVLVCLLFMPMVLGGYAYSFGIYANELKASLDLTQAELATLSSAIFVAGVFKWAPGMFIDRYGERLSILTGAFSATLCMILYWCIARRVVHVPSTIVVAALSILGLMVYVSQSLISGSVFKGIVSICGSGSKGVVVGIAKGYIGLGAGAYAVMFKSLRRESDLDLLLMGAGFFFLFGLLIPSVMIPKDPFDRLDHLTPLHFRVLYASQILMALLVVGESLFSLFYGKQRSAGLLEQMESPGPDHLRYLSVFILWTGPILALLFLPRAKQMGLPTIEEETESLVASEDSGRADEMTKSSRSFTLYQLLQTVPAWLILWTFAVLAGAGVYVTQNLGQMCVALKFGGDVIPASVALFSVANMSSRIVTGALAEIVVQRGCARPILVSLGAILATVAHAMLATSSSEFTFIASVALAGFAYGMIWPLVVLIVGDIYGKKYLAGNYLFVEGLTIAAGTLLLSKFVSQSVYQHHLHEGSTTCVGRGCFQATHWTACALCLTAIGTSVCLLGSKLARQAYSNELAHLH